MKEPPEFFNKGVAHSVLKSANLTLRAALNFIDEGKKDEKVSRF